ncbi:enoyl-CoA hydratase-related protein [Deinococcus radiophilus]|uniref:2-(1,2-epoxy-1,2-dihydrophenyl)acetyl-CoA isomerase n=1 Tax=Deinococcus radiophilus TaxID=32062 RepID=A0A431W332_9DEIO|nr:enoyl-CoA hydratase-related protein [Deinococcus radiophilus]RTR29834.1 2-(1,2-epoxy-1,2-dihydrophenyl)acetyl-CoA isomerase [Deinococcus radiophilus]UFA49818.1 enoyl-CoA hydratase-related protein [Deinococcus radiophilus]
MTALVLTRDQAGVRTLSLNSPDRLNALTAALATQLLTALQAAAQDPGVRVVVLTGEGRGFCAGQDLSEVAGPLMSGQPLDLEAHLNDHYRPVILAIREMNKPVIAAVNGVAAGAGASLALACDLRVSSESAQWVQIFSNIALIPDAGSTWFLPHLVGFGRAFELMALAEKVSAGQAHALGLCQQVYPDETFTEQTQAYAAALAARPAQALALTKQALNAAMSSRLEDALDLEAKLQQQAASSQDFREGVQAFMEKRVARWAGAPQES